jgi:hypothetical protein
MTGRIILICLIISLQGAAPALGLSISSSVDKNQVALGDPITLSVLISGEGGSTPDPVMPDLSDFDVYSSGKNTSITFENGKFASTLEMSYVLVPKKIGSLTIGPVTVKQKNQTARSNPIQIEVTKPGQIGSGTPSQRKTQRTTTPNRTENFFIEQTVDKRRPYVGEQVTLTFRFYQAENLWEQPSLAWPEFNGFTIEDLPPNNRYIKIINNKRYQVTEIKRAIFPITSGEFVIDSPRLTIREDIFDSFRDPFNMFRRGRRAARSGGPQVLTTDPIKLTVRQLPSRGKPADFSGAVGQYNIKVSVDKDSVGVDEPITMKVTLSGTGNIKSLPAIAIPEMQDFRVYESGKTESISNSGGTVSGSKTFEQAVIPVTSGNFQIPSIEFSFFNPARGQYQTVSTKPVDILASGEVLVDIAGAPQNVIGAGNKSFTYILTDFSPPGKSIDLYNSFWFWIIQFVPLVGITAALFFRMRFRKMLGDHAYARRMSAGKKSRMAFKSALRKKESGDTEGFYGDMYNSMVGLIADRLNLEKSALTVDDIKDIDKIDRQTLTDLTEFLDNCLDARYAPGANSSAGMEETAKKASRLLGRLEKTL